MLQMTGRSKLLERIGVTALLVISTLTTYAVVEVVWRVYLFQSFRNRLVFQLSKVPTDDPRERGSIYHPEMGYSYRPNVTVSYVDKFPIRYHINRWGHVGNSDYPLEKPANEYRIVVVGASFAANIHNTLRWPALVEEKLNKNDHWLQHVRGKRTRVINVARDGIGLVQFDKVLLFDGLRFSPDLVLVSFATDNLAQMPYFRGNLPDMSTEERANYVWSYATKAVKRLPWSTPYPEVLAVLFNEKIVRSRLIANVQLLNDDRYYADKSKAADVSVASIRRILSAHPNVHILHHPDYHDFRAHVPGHLTGVLENFERSLADVHIERMLQRFPAYRDLGEMQSWFNYPHDFHMSDKGLSMYADYATNYLVEIAAAKSK